MIDPLSGPYGPRDQWDLPLGGLPGATRIQFERTHMEAAVAEVRFVSEYSALDRTVAVQVWEALGTDQFPHLEPSAQFMADIELGPDGAGVPSQHRVDGWSVATADRDTVVTLLPTAVVVQTRSYKRYSTDLGGPMATVLDVFVESSGLRHIQRLGLRYVNRLTATEATSPAFWHDHVRDSFRGPLGGSLGTLTTNVHQQAEFKLDSTAGARIQSGAFEDPIFPDEKSPRYSYLIDLDVFREQASTYDPDWCSNQLRQLNRTALSLFATVLTDKYLTDLGPTSVPPPESDTETSDSSMDSGRELEEGR